MRILGIDNRISFQRRPKPQEEQGLRHAILDAYKVMGTSDRVVITHGSCFPALERDTYIGSPFGKSAKEYTKFLMLYGFNGNQLGPVGELEADESGISASPYNSSAFVKNRLFIDLSELTEEKYAKILSKKTYNEITRIPETPSANYVETNFNEAEKIYDIALNESYETFRAKVRNGHPQALKLAKEYENFLSKYNPRLIDEGIFKVLAKQYGTDVFDDWNNQTDEDLIRLVKSGDKTAISRYNYLLKNHKKDINLHKFEQFIITKQIIENKQWRDEQGFKYINDLLVGCSQMDYWRCREAFIDGFQLGASEGSGKNPQAWNIPVLNPRKLFKDDGLGVAGEFLKDKLDYALEFCENLRVDHVMGLIEPFVIENSSIVYDKNKNIENNPYDNPVNGKYISQMWIDGRALDDYKNYSCDYTHSDGRKTYHSNIMDKIVIPTLKEHGIDPNDVVWEDLCSQPEAFRGVFYDNLNLPGISQTEYVKVESTPSRNWHFVGSHDSIPAMKMPEREWTKNSDAWNPLYLAGYLNMDSGRANERDEFCNKIAANDRDLVRAKFAELLTTEKFQISFADLFGITGTTYNQAGTRNSTNWKERIPANYIEQYYENLASENPTALNIPELLKEALQARIDMKVVKSENPDKTRFELSERYKPLLDELQKYADILKDPEE